MVVSILSLHRPVERLSLFAGVGRELEKHESFWVYRFGLSFDIASTETWDFGLDLTYDLKQDVYDAWSFGLGLARKF